MSSRHISRKRFTTSLTSTRNMATVSAVVLGTTFMPLLGLPDMAEFHAFQGAIESFSDARAAVLTPHRNDEAARERSAQSVIAEEPGNHGASSASGGANRVLTVERPTRPQGEPFDATTVDANELAPLPSADELTLAAPVDDEQALPEPVEVQADAPALEGPDDLDAPEDVEEQPLDDKPKTEG
jgi:hypothetical protein